ncbi:MAG: aminopeptidase [Candidatus Krumholzibacteria bacterium]|nr:aminopeptidase [Candidatus Krumholzibacteria bacterium]
MKDRERMATAARDAMAHVLDLEPSDRVLVVTDLETAACGEAFAQGAEDHGCAVTIYRLPAAGRPLREIPDDLPPFLDDTTVVINAIVGAAAEVPFRLKWIHAIEDTGRIRMGHSPGIDVDMMISGALSVDYGAMAKMAERLYAGFQDAVHVHLTTPAGTNLHLDLTGRTVTDDLKATVEVGANLPCGEVYCAPVEDGANGIVVVDGCFGSYGLVPSPVKIRVLDGLARGVVGDDSQIVEIINCLLDTDAGSRTIAELGIGLNSGARLTDCMLEAEKVLGTAHVAFGDNEGLGGGQSRSSMHVDYLLKKPTLEVTLKDGSQRLVMQDGQVK